MVNVKKGVENDAVFEGCSDALVKDEESLPIMQWTEFMMFQSLWGSVNTAAYNLHKPAAWWNVEMNIMKNPLSVKNVEMTLEKTADLNPIQYVMG